MKKLFFIPYLLFILLFTGCPALMLPTQFSIYYDANGAESGSVPLDDNLYDPGVEVSVAGFGDLVKSGYSINSWNTTADGTGSGYVEGDTLVTGDSDITLYAQWNLVSGNFSVTYDGNGFDGGAVPSDSKTYAEGASVVLADSGTMSRKMYKFGNWNTVADGSGSAISSGDTFTMGQSNIVFYAQWSPLAMNSVTYDGNGSDGGVIPSDKEKYAEGAVFTLADAGTMSKSSYYFSGWNTAADGSGTAVNSGAEYTMGNEAVTFYAQWSLTPTYGVSYDRNEGDGGTVPSDSNRYEKGAAVTVETQGDLYRTGYSFSGWNTAADGAGSAVSVGSSLTMDSSDLVLYAQWSINTYAIVFDKNGGSGTISNQNIVFGGKAGITANSFTRSGYSFTDWNTEADGSGTAYADQAEFTMGAANITLYARWSANHYTITFNRNGGTGTMPDQSFAYATSKTLSAGTFVRNDYLFSGWNSKADGTGTSYGDQASFTMGNTDMTLYAVWTASNALWGKSATTAPSTNIFNGLVGDSSGNTIALGYQYGKDEYVYGSVSAESGGTSNFNNAVIVKYDSSGTAQWAKTTIGTSGTLTDSFFMGGVADSSGNIFAVGYQYDNKIVNYGSGSVLGGFPGGYNAVIVKYNSSGTTQWAKPVAAASNQSYFYNAATDSSGNVYAVGLQRGDGSYTYSSVTVSGGSTNSNGVIVKYNANGVGLWAKALGSGSGIYQYNATVTDRSGYVYAVGQSDTNAVIVKYDSSGNLLWEKTASGSGISYFNGVTIDSSGNLYAGGRQAGNGSYSYGSISVTGSSSGANAVLVKYNSSGEVQWAKSVSSGTGYSCFNSLSADSSGNILAAGYQTLDGSYQYGTGIAVSGTNTTAITSPDTAKNSLIVKYNSAGVAQWAKSISSGSQPCYFTGVVVDSFGNTYTSGVQRQNGGFSYGSDITVSGASTGDNGVIVKYSP